MRNLAQMIHLGRGTAKNDEAALAWYQKAAAQDDARALFMCGQFYEKGFGVECNAPLAADFYLRAARQGYAPAQACYAICLEYGRGVPANPTEAVEWYTRAASRGTPRRSLPGPSAASRAPARPKAGGMPSAGTAWPPHRSCPRHC